MPDLRENRNSTEKGRLYLLDTQRKRSKSNKGALLRSADEVDHAIENGESAENVRKFYSEWLCTYENYLEANELIYNNLTDPAEKYNQSDIFQTENANFIQFKQKAEHWFNSLPNTFEIPASNISIAKSVKSNLSNRSSCGSARSKSSQLSMIKIKEEQKKAELLAKADALCKKQELDKAK